jgi:SpoIID/LytB domain protein
MRRVAVAALVALALPGAATASVTFVVDGGGWGHGVGMSQYGARGYAERAWGYERILSHYYRGTTLGALPNRKVRVLVAERRGRVVIGAGKPFRRVVGRERSTLHAGNRTLTPMVVQRLGGLVRYEPGAKPLRVGKAAYRGAVVVYVEGGKLFAVNVVSLDHYLRGVVPLEMPHDWPHQALEAQVVVARSYTLATLHPQNRYDLYSDTRDQVYGGIAAEKPETNRAVAETAGRVVLWNGRVATTYYHSTSGGRTATVTDVWPRAGFVPYLVAVPDPFDGDSRWHRWVPTEWTPGALGQKLRFPGLRDIRVTRNESGRADSVEILGTGAGRTLTGEEFKDVLGLRSTAFRVCVFSLQPKASRVRRGKPVELTGFVRGMTGVRLQRAIGAGGWQPVRAIRLAPTGRFRTVVRPDAATRYRLASKDGAAGQPVQILVS